MAGLEIHPIPRTSSPFAGFVSGASDMSGCGGAATSSETADGADGAGDAGDISSDPVPAEVYIDIEEISLPIADKDGDGFCEAGYEIQDRDLQCPLDIEYIGTDCDDNDPSIHPGAEEIESDGIDQNCNGHFDEDIDGDKFTVNEGDCHDEDSSINPGAKDLFCDYKDYNCDGLDVDNDYDGYGGCLPWEDDCDDNNPAVNPGLHEICDDLDNNCNDEIDENCVAPCEEGKTETYYTGPTETENVGNCKPGILICENGFWVIEKLDVIPKPEICNGLDEDCDGQIDEENACPSICIDSDSDGYGENCELGPDCDDTDPEINPAAEEIACNEVDENCDGEDLIIEGYFGFTENIIPASSADAVFIGETSQWRAGAYVAATGDYNNDGKKDLIIGSITHVASDDNDDKVYLFYGDNFSGNYDLSSADAIFNVGPTNLPNYYQNYYPEYRICPNGNINGDDYDDLFISFHPTASPFPEQTMALFYGGTFSGNYTLSSANAFFINNDYTHSLYMRVDPTAGDINNDGKDDLLSWNFVFSGGEHYTSASVILGQDFSGNYDINSVIQSSFSTSYNSSGPSGVSICDVNGDQSLDLLVSLNQNPTPFTSPGKTFLFYDAQNLSGEYDLFDANAIITGEEVFTGDRIYCSDLNKDGFDDIFISAPYDNGYLGKVYVFNGGNLTGDYVVSQANIIFNGEYINSLAWTDISSGDIDGDGDHELIISASFGKLGANAETLGLIYLMDDANNLNGEYSLPSSATFIIAGEIDSGYFGRSISIGDVNGDGIDDLLVGAPGSTITGTPENYFGKAYLFYGEPSCQPIN